MRALVPLTFAFALAWGYDSQINRKLAKGKPEKAGRVHGEYIGEAIGGSVGVAAGIVGSALLGSVTGGNIGTRAARVGVSTYVAKIGGRYGAIYGGEAGASVGKKMDQRKTVKGAKTAKGAKILKTLTETNDLAKIAKNKKEREEKEPILFKPAGYKPPLTRSQSSPSTMQRLPNPAIDKQRSKVVVGAKAAKKKRL